MRPLPRPRWLSLTRNFWCRGGGGGGDIYESDGLAETKGWRENGASTSDRRHKAAAAQGEAGCKLKGCSVRADNPSVIFHPLLGTILFPFALSVTG